MQQSSAASRRIKTHGSYVYFFFTHKGLCEFTNMYMLLLYSFSTLDDYYFVCIVAQLIELGFY